RPTVPNPRSVPPTVRCPVALLPFPLDSAPTREPSCAPSPPAVSARPSTLAPATFVTPKRKCATSMSSPASLDCAVAPSLTTVSSPSAGGTPASQLAPANHEPVPGFVHVIVAPLAAAGSVAHAAAHTAAWAPRRKRDFMLFSSL